MSKFKLFISNFFIYGIGGVISKIIPFVMLPIITRIFPDTSYMGLNEMYNTISSFAGAIALFGMYDGMFRFFFEREDTKYKRGICSTAFFFAFFNAGLVMIVMMAFQMVLSSFFFEDTQYTYLVALSAVGTPISVLSIMLAAPTRMENKRRVFLITNTAAPIIAYSLALYFLYKGMYEIALPLGNIISCATISLVFFLLNRKWFSLKCIELKKLKELFTVAVPVVPITFVYWVFNSCDRVMITRLISVDATGIYGVAGKLGAISQLIYTAFSGGWQYFAYSTMKDSDQIATNSRIMEYLFSVSAIATMCICVLAYPLCVLLFEQSYIEGFIAIPYLFFSPLLQMLFQILGSQLTIRKKTWMNTVFLVVGTLLNVIANYFLIPVLGVEGAAISTLIGYTVSIVLSVIFNIKYGYIKISFRLCMSCGLLCFFFLMWRFVFLKETILIGISALLVAITIFARMYLKEFSEIFQWIRRRGVFK